MRDTLLIWAGTLTGIVLNNVNEWLAFASSAAAIVYTILKIRNEVKKYNDGKH